MKFKIGNGTCSAAYRFTVHPAHKTDERLGGREKRQDIVTLISNLGTGNLDKSGIVCTGFKAKLARPFSINLPRSYPKTRLLSF
jgi:hypothetical protein